LAAESRRILVTGGAGYIGSHASKALAQAGYDVVVLDNLSAGHRAAVTHAELIEGDVGDVALVRHLLRDHQISAVMHFAAFLDVGESVRDPAKYYRNNVVATLNRGRFFRVSRGGEPIARRRNLVIAVAEKREGATGSLATLAAGRRPSSRGLHHGSRLPAMSRGEPQVGVWTGAFVARGWRRIIDRCPS